MADSDSTRGRAEAAFRSYLEEVRAGKAPSPESFLDRQPEDIRGELRTMLDDYAFFQAESGEAGDAGRVLGDFLLVRELGRGGMGVVWEAEQRSLGRRVALKLLPPHLGVTPRAIERFQREAQAGGRLTHPGIVTVHAVGEADGTHYFAQELVPGGRSLDDHLEELRQLDDLPPEHYRAIATLFAKVADALAFAHASGVVHRDVKPGNILLAGEEPKVADFGVARIQQGMSLSRSGDFLGTPFYMSPEQVTPKGLALDERSDVFSLGATLYEALTLVRPFHGDTTHQVVEKILLEDPPDPRRLRSKVPRDLAVICLKALEKLPRHRYAGMEEMASDLRRYLEAQPLAAKPPGPLARVGKWVRRRPAQAVAIGAVLMGVAGIAGFALDAQAARRRAELAADKATAEQENASAVVTYLARLFEVNSPGIARGEVMTARDLLDHGARTVRDEFADRPEILAELLHTLGSVYLNLGQLKEARRLLTDALEIRREISSDSHPKLLATLNQLSKVELGERNYGPATDYAREAQEGHARHYGEDHPKTLENMGHLALVYFRQGRLAEARPLLEGSLRGCRELYGEDHNITQTARNNLATLLVKERRFQEAEPVLLETLAYRRRHSGDDHPTVLGVMNTIATLYRKMERLELAEQYYLDTLQGSRKVHGSDSSITAGVQYGLAMVYEEQERYEEAAAAFQESWEVMRAAVGEDHPEAVKGLRALAEFHYHRDHAEEALRHARELLRLTPRDDTDWLAWKEMVDELEARLDPGVGG